MITECFETETGKLTAWCDLKVSVRLSYFIVTKNITSPNIGTSFFFFQTKQSGTTLLGKCSHWSSAIEMFPGLHTFVRPDSLVSWNNY